MCILYVFVGSEGGSVRWKLYREVLCQVFAMEGWIPIVGFLIKYDFSLNDRNKRRPREDEKGGRRRLIQ